MCGIAGYVGESPPSQGRLENALGTLRHRGPDGRGVWRGHAAACGVSLVHTRLAIIDLDPRSDQPFRCPDTGVALSFNGEIYNYREVRETLKGLGHAFATDSDTEVLLAAYKHWGAACVNRLEGMWAFALFDPREGAVLLSRDRFGEKPLYVRETPGGVAFASTIQALAALTGQPVSVDRERLAVYLVNGYRAVHKSPRSMFEGITCFPAGHNAWVRCAARGAVMEAPRAYWSLRYDPVEMTGHEAVEGVRDALDRSVRLRLRADVPLAFCLSGGVDSGTLAGIAAKRLSAEVHCFSIVDGGDPRYNERDNMTAVAQDLGCPHEIVELSTDGFLDRMARITAFRDSPIATISYYIHAFLIERMAARGFKVSLSGTGADELLTGYYDHYSMWLGERKAAVSPQAFDALVDDWRAGYGAAVRNPLLQDPEAFARDPNQRGHIYLERDRFNALMRQPVAEDFHEADLSDNPLRRRMLNELFHESVPVILQEDDANAMGWSMENRSPYLDRALAEFCYQVPNALLMEQGYAKWLLRAAGEGMLTDQVRLDKTKKGFNASIDTLLDRQDPTVREALLAPSPIFDIVDRARFERFLDGDMSANSASKFLFSFVASKLFLESPLASGVVPDARAA